MKEGEIRVGLLTLEEMLFSRIPPEKREWLLKIINVKNISETYYWYNRLVNFSIKRNIPLVKLVDTLYILIEKGIGLKDLPEIFEGKHIIDATVLSFLNNLPLPTDARYKLQYSSENINYITKIMREKGTSRLPHRRLRSFINLIKYLRRKGYESPRELLLREYGEYIRERYGISPENLFKNIAMIWDIDPDKLETDYGRPKRIDADSNSAWIVAFDNFLKRILGQRIKKGEEEKYIQGDLTSFLKKKPRKVFKELKDLILKAKKGDKEAALKVYNKIVAEYIDWDRIKNLREKGKYTAIKRDIDEVGEILRGEFRVLVTDIIKNRIGIEDWLRSLEDIRVGDEVGVCVSFISNYEDLGDGSLWWLLNPLSNIARVFYYTDARKIHLLTIYGIIAEINGEKVFLVDSIERSGGSEVGNIISRYSSYGDLPYFIAYYLKEKMKLLGLSSVYIYGAGSGNSITRALYDMGLLETAGTVYLRILGKEVISDILEKINGRIKNYWVDSERRHGNYPFYKLLVNKVKINE